MSALWLASGSPRRKVLLSWAGEHVEARPADVDESRLPGEAPIAYVRRLAAAKAATGPSDRAVVAADTIVHRGDVTYGKPVDRAEARRFLRELSGVWHAVSTGWCVQAGGERVVGHTTTEVRFRALADAEIDAYLETGEADDKAGAYGIQGRAGVFVAEVRGCWTNVMGLPMEDVLAAIGQVRSGGAR